LDAAQTGIYIWVMDDDPRDSRVVEHIRSISARAESDAEGLLVRMLAGSWPGDTGDRTAPGARDWVRRWGPRAFGCLPPACSCSRGGCLVCN